MFPNSSFLLPRIFHLPVLLGMLVLPALAADPAPDAAQARFEVDFIADLIDHDQAAVEMAQLVEARSSRPELREFATTGITAQTAEIKALQDWLKEWYGETHEPEPGRRTERQIAALTDLQRDDFEQAFLRALSLHHAETLVMASGALLRADHSQLVDQVRETAALQADEIALMRGWLKTWYDIGEVTPSDLPDNRRWDTQGPVRPTVTGTVPATTTTPTTITTPATNTAPTAVTTPSSQPTGVTTPGRP
jgi:uncharacterized protein (DUF305 family)